MGIREPGYIRLHERNELAGRIEAAQRILSDCTLCPRQCHVNRWIGEKGICRIGASLVISSYGPHFGEEPPLVGRQGSGTIFLAGCNLTCVYCQNYDISQLGEGSGMDAGEFGEMMLSLQRQGCHNINFVTPTHQAAQILSALPHAVERGLHVPLVYNCGGYENTSTLRLLEDVIDIYMPDFKYGDSEIALRLSDASNYTETAKAALLEMHRQVGNLVVDDRGIAVRGLMVRHLVLPGGLSGTRQVMRFIARELSPDTYVNIMPQYHPCYHASEHPPLNRRITRSEYEEALLVAKQEGLRRLDASAFPER